MTDLEGRLSAARTRLTELLQDSRAGVPRAQVLLGVLALAAELTGFVFEQAAEGLGGRR